MFQKTSNRMATLAGTLLVLLTLFGCAGKRAYHAGEEFALHKQYDEAVASYQQAVEKNPERSKYRMRLIEVRSQAAQAHLVRGRELLAAGKRSEALLELRKATSYDPSLGVAAQEAQQIENLLRAEQLVAEGEGFYRNRRFAHRGENQAHFLHAAGEPLFRQLFRTTQALSNRSSATVWNH